MTASPNPRLVAYRPGDRAPSSGVYRALHLRHRMPHEITVLEEEVFPTCKRCGVHVRFELVFSAPRATGDIDLMFVVQRGSSTLSPGDH